MPDSTFPKISPAELAIGINLSNFAIRHSVPNANKLIVCHRRMKNINDATVTFGEQPDWELSQPHCFITRELSAGSHLQILIDGQPFFTVTTTNLIIDRPHPKYTVSVSEVFPGFPPLFLSIPS